MRTASAPGKVGTSVSVTGRESGMAGRDVGGGVTGVLAAGGLGRRGCVVGSGVCGATAVGVTDLEGGVGGTGTTTAAGGTGAGLARSG